MSILDKDRGSLQVNEKGQSKKGINFGVIPMQDLDWILTQKPSVIQLFIECWRCDPYGSRWMQLNTKLKDRAFRDAKKKLSDQGLLVFKRETSIQDSRSTVCWMVKNLHGSRVKGYWEDCKAEVLGGTTTPDCGATMPECSTSVPILGTAMPPISPQTQMGQGSQNASISFQYLNSISSSISPAAPLESGEEEFKFEEKKEEEKETSNEEELLKWVMELKIPALNLKDPPRNPEAYGRAMITNDGDALRKEFGEVVAERDFYTRASELTQKVETRAMKWEASGLKVVVFHDLSGMPAVMLDGTAITAIDFLAKPIEQPPLDPIAVLSNPDNIQNRKVRQSRLKCADRLGECPGVEFLAECWGDILLRSQVKSMIAKYPQWDVTLGSFNSTVKRG